MIRRWDSFNNFSGQSFWLRKLNAADPDIDLRRLPARTDLGFAQTFFALCLLSARPRCEPFALTERAPPKITPATLRTVPKLLRSPLSQ